MCCHCSQVLDNLIQTTRALATDPSTNPLPDALTALSDQEAYAASCARMNNTLVAEMLRVDNLTIGLLGQVSCLGFPVYGVLLSCLAHSHNMTMGLLEHCIAHFHAACSRGDRHRLPLNHSCASNVMSACVTVLLAACFYKLSAL